MKPVCGINHNIIDGSQTEEPAIFLTGTQQLQAKELSNSSIEINKKYSEIWTTNKDQYILDMAENCPKLKES